MARDDYKCDSCGVVDDRKRSINDKPLPTVKCNKCPGVSRYQFSAHAKTDAKWRV